MTSDIRLVLCFERLSFGLIATFLLTLVTAGYLSSAPAQAHAVMPDGVATVSEKAAVLLFGWLRYAGDLRVAHFFATHALHFVPLAGWLIARIVSANEPGSSQSRRIALSVSLLYAFGVLFVFLQALSGKPFI